LSAKSSYSTGFVKVERAACDDEVELGLAIEAVLVLSVVEAILVVAEELELLTLVVLDEVATAELPDVLGRHWEYQALPEEQ
jgi:hypothetical protein